MLEKNKSSGSRTYPPTTSIGEEGVISKEFPYLFLPRTFLFGLIRVEKWGFYWGYTKAYIELLNVDTTMNEYDNDNSTNGNSKTKVTADSVAETLRIWEQSHKSDKKE